MTKTLVIGQGEIGSAIYELESEAGSELSGIDLEEASNLREDNTYDVAHVCIPYSDNFVDVIVEYLNEYKVGICIIHSTVPVGTCRKICELIGHRSSIIYSFVRGVHPNLVDGLKTFVKYCYSEAPEAAVPSVLAQQYLLNIGITTKYGGVYEEGELAKLLDTTYYGYNILFAKHVKDMCDCFEVDFDKVYTGPNETYNEGYKELGKENVIRPVLYPPEGAIGGHCVVPNFHLLPESDLKQWCLQHLDE